MFDNKFRCCLSSFKMITCFKSFPLFFHMNDVGDTVTPSLTFYSKVFLSRHMRKGLSWRWRNFSHLPPFIVTTRDGRQHEEKRNNEILCNISLMCNMREEVVETETHRERVKITSWLESRIKRLRMKMVTVTAVTLCWFICSFPSFHLRKDEDDVDEHHQERKVWWTTQDKVREQKMSKLFCPLDNGTEMMRNLSLDPKWDDQRENVVKEFHLCSRELLLSFLLVVHNMMMIKDLYGYFCTVGLVCNLFFSWWPGYSFESCLKLLLDSEEWETHTRTIMDEKEREEHRSASLFVVTRL
jgi:hypothetical protein